MIPPTTTGTSTPSPRSNAITLGHELEVAAREDRQAHDVDVLVAGGRGDLLGREPDAGVHDLHARVACRHGDLLGAVRVTVEARLGDEEPRRTAAASWRSNANQITHVAVAMTHGRADACRRPVLAKDLA